MMHASYRPPPSHAGWARDADGNWTKLVEGSAQHCFNTLLDVAADAAAIDVRPRGETPATGARGQVRRAADLLQAQEEATAP